jgi:hypothetical protein
MVRPDPRGGDVDTRHPKVLHEGVGVGDGRRDDPTAASEFFKGHRSTPFLHVQEGSDGEDHSKDGPPPRPKALKVSFDGFIFLWEATLCQKDGICPPKMVEGFSEAPAWEQASVPLPVGNIDQNEVDRPGQASILKAVVQEDHVESPVLSGQGISRLPTSAHGYGDRDPPGQHGRFVPNVSPVRDRAPVEVHPDDTPTATSVSAGEDEGRVSKGPEVAGQIHHEGCLAAPAGEETPHTHDGYRQADRLP